MVFFGSKDNKFYALDSETGAELWKFTGSIRSANLQLAKTEGFMWVLKTEKSIRLIFKATNFGNLLLGTKWSKTLDGNGKLLLGSCDNKFYALNCNNGTKLWNSTPGHKYIPKRFYPKTENCSSAQRATQNCMHLIHQTDQKFGNSQSDKKFGLPGPRS